MFFDYLLLCVWILTLTFLLFILFLVSMCIRTSLNDNNYEKASIYECGFDPFTDVRQKFDIKYYLVAILFLIFDLEFLYLIPWLLVLPNANGLQIIVMIWFLFILVLGFFYEWKSGALDWN